MPRIVPLVEGDGEISAVPLLVRRILEQNTFWDWSVSRPLKVGHIKALTNNLDRYLQLAQRQPDCGGILILLDLDDGCPQEEAKKLANQARQLYAHAPIAIALAHHEYEAWFLASLETIAGSYDLPSGLTYSGDVETIRGVKEWLTTHMSPGRSYKPTLHQDKLTARIDLALARQRSRSFRRLWHAIAELVHAASTSSRGYVTP